MAQPLDGLAHQASADTATLVVREHGDRAQPEPSRSSVRDAYGLESSRLEFERLDPRQCLRCLGGLPCLPEVVRRLLSQPNFGSASMITS